MLKKAKLIRITTVPVSLLKLLENQLSYMSAYYEVIAVSSDKEVLDKVKDSEGVEVFHVEMTRKITPFKDLLSVWKLYRFFRREKPLIVHTHTPKAGTVGMIAARLAGVPNRLHTVAGLPLMEAKGGKRKLLNAVEKITYSCATKVYPNSKGLHDFILNNKLTQQHKLSVIANGSSNGIDTGHFNNQRFTEREREELKRKLEITPGDFVFVFIGRMVSDKGVNELIEAFKGLEAQGVQAKLLLVGPFEEDLDPLNPASVMAITSEANIRYVGFQQDVRPFLAISDCLVFPSYREGFPNVVMQAGAMGIPAIVSDINGCNEIVVEGINGTIVPVKDAKVLKDAMVKMMTDIEFRTSLREHAREMIISRYDQKFVWEAILKEYKQVAQEF